MFSKFEIQRKYTVALLFRYLAPPPYSKRKIIHMEGGEEREVISELLPSNSTCQYNHTFKFMFLITQYLLGSNGVISMVGQLYASQLITLNDTYYHTI